jgi:tetratricopeptide (TPR) repeat protein
MYRPSFRVDLKFVSGITLLLSVLLFSAQAARSQEEPAVKTDDPVELFEKGQDAHSKGNFQDAIDLYDQALKVLPEFAEAEYQKGNAYLALGKRSDAESAFRRAVGIRGEWTLALTALGTSLERRGEYVESERLLTKAIAIDGSNFPAYSGLIELRLKSGASADVMKPLLEKVRVFSSKANAGAPVFAAEATLENALGDRAAAKKSIQRALVTDPNNKIALYLKAEIALVEGDRVLAEEITRSLEKSDAGNESVKLLRARILIADNKPQDAAKLLASIETPSPETVQLAQKVALANERSPEALEKALVQQPNDAFILGKLCSAYRITAPDKALDYCRRALDVEPSNINFATGFGAALLQAKRYEDAVTVLKRLAAAAPESATVHANLGTALFQLKRFAEAKAEYQWLTAHDPVPPVAYYFLAICHDQLGEFMDAGANYNLFLKYADASQNQLEIDKVKLRLPILEKQIKQNGGRSKTKGDR